jgi:hypothetical protein
MEIQSKKLHEAPLFGPFLQEKVNRLWERKTSVLFSFFFFLFKIRGKGKTSVR